MARPSTLIQTATIAAAGSLSGAVQVAGYRIASIMFPSGWDAADATFSGRYDKNSTTYVDIYEDATDTELTVQAGASRIVLLTGDKAEGLLGLESIKVRSGTSGSAVAQGDEVIVSLALVKV